jgi:hypothetical protein
MARSGAIGAAASRAISLSWLRRCRPSPKHTTVYRWVACGGVGSEPASEVEDYSEGCGDDPADDQASDQDLSVFTSVGTPHSGEQVIPVFFFITSREQHALTGLVAGRSRGVVIWQPFGFGVGSTKWMSELWFPACALDMAGRVLGYGFWLVGLPGLLV